MGGTKRKLEGGEMPVSKRHAGMGPLSFDHFCLILPYLNFVDLRNLSFTSKTLYECVKQVGYHHAQVYFSQFLRSGDLSMSALCRAYHTICTEDEFCESIKHIGELIKAKDPEDLTRNSMVYFYVALAQAMRFNTNLTPQIAGKCVFSQLHTHTNYELRVPLFPLEMAYIMQFPNYQTFTLTYPKFRSRSYFLFNRIRFASLSMSAETDRFFCRLAIKWQNLNVLKEFPTAYAVRNQLISNLLSASTRESLPALLDLMIQSRYHVFPIRPTFIHVIYTIIRRYGKQLLLSHCQKHYPHLRPTLPFCRALSLASRKRIKDYYKHHHKIAANFVEFNTIGSPAITYVVMDASSPEFEAERAFLKNNSLHMFGQTLCY